MTFKEILQEQQQDKMDYSVGLRLMRLQKNGKITDVIEHNDSDDSKKEEEE